MAVSCAGPVNFVRLSGANETDAWISIPVRDEVSYDDAWEAVTDAVSKRFSIEMISKPDGYLRTGWHFGWTGRNTPNYKVRIIVKYSQKRKVVDIKCEAEQLTRQGWIMGFDTALIQTVRTDISGRVSGTVVH